jgi:uncharacterized membrane protein
MSDLIAVAYPDRATAEKVRDELARLTREHVIEIEDAVVVAREPDGKVKLHQTLNPTGSGAAVFALVRKVTPDKVVPRISQYGGKILQTSLSNESEQRLQEALDAAASAGA